MTPLITAILMNTVYSQSSHTKHIAIPSETHPSLRKGSTQDTDTEI